MTWTATQPSLTCATTVHELLAEQVAADPERRFLSFEERHFTRREFQERSRATAAALHSLGLGRGDRIALMLSNRPEFMFLWFGCSILGAVEVPVNTGQKGELLRYVLEQAKCRALVAETAFWAQLEPVIERASSLELAIFLDGVPQHRGRVQVTGFEALPTTSAPPDQQLGGDAPHAIMFTSGTTGPSKGAMMPHSFPLVVGEITARNAGYTHDDVLYNALPLFHGNAQFLSTIPALLSGARLVLARRFSASQFWNDIRANGCTEFNYIGSIIPILMKAAPSPADRDHAVRVMVGAGAPKDLFRPFERRFGVRLIEGYGMSEIGIPLQTMSDDTPPGSCGTQHPWYDIRLVNDAGEEAADDEPGELLVRPKIPGAMMLEYFGMAEQTVEAWRDLWFHTGDYLRRDADGYYWFIDRKKDALRRRGENISSWEVEKIITAHPDVLECAAIAVPAELGEDEVMVCVAPRAGLMLEPARLAEWCQERMASFMVPRYIRVMPALPKTATERVQKFELRRQGVTADTWDRTPPAATERT
ncbi:MAG TPA: AMP-binding protein [Steroidobacteraceae bacterium]|nr:AMP-binding protein [Steroidobacteraceae bacterium]